MLFLWTGFLNSTIDGITYSAARKVSTVLCIRDIPCSPSNCSGNGFCRRGVCHCQGNWHGDGCNDLQCGLDNCTQRGICTEGL